MIARVDAYPMPANSAGVELADRVHQLASADGNPCQNVLIVLACFSRRWAPELLN